MPAKSAESPPAAKKCCGCRCKYSLLAIFLVLFSALYSYLNPRLEKFYVFDPEHLHDLSQRAISAHGNDTKAVVNFIVDGLDQKMEGKYLNKHEEWVFNNAGGAMGAMYIIHASITEYLIIFGEFNFFFLPCCNFY